MPYKTSRYVSYFLWSNSLHRVQRVLKRRFKQSRKRKLKSKRKRVRRELLRGELYVDLRRRQLTKAQRKLRQNVKRKLHVYQKHKARRMGVQMNRLDYGFVGAYLPQKVPFYFDAAYPPDKIWLPYRRPGLSLYPDLLHGKGPVSYAPDKNIPRKVNKRLIPVENAPLFERLGLPRAKHTFLCLAFPKHARPELKVSFPWRRTFTVRPELLGEMPHMIAKAHLYLNPMIVRAPGPKFFLGGNVNRTTQLTHRANAFKASSAGLRAASRPRRVKKRRPTRIVKTENVAYANFMSNLGHINQPLKSRNRNRLKPNFARQLPRQANPSKVYGSTYAHGKGTAYTPGQGSAAGGITQRLPRWAGVQRAEKRSGSKKPKLNFQIKTAWTLV